MFDPTGTTKVSHRLGSWITLRMLTLPSRAAMIYLRYNYRKGFMGYSHGTVKKEATKGKQIFIYENSVYDMSTYVQNGG